MSSSLRSKYRIASHVHACRSGPHIVFLDLRRDKYFGLNEPETKVLREHITDLVELTADMDAIEPTSAGESSNTVKDSTEIFQQMLRNGILVADSGVSRSSSVASLPKPEMALIEGYQNIPIEIKWTNIVWFLAASLTATVLLQWRSLEYTVERFHRRRKAKLPGQSTISAQIDQNHLQKQVAIFRRLRPLFFTSQNKCLFNALALSEFLAYRGLFPQWVFGVRTEPFHAHCWLQHGNTIIDDTPEHVGSYMPIMAI